MERIEYLSAADHSLQPALICPAEGDSPRPLAVCLHTWSYGLEPPYDHFAAACQRRNWHMIFPLFRGPNWQPEACGSDLVVSDLACAVDYMKNHYAVDEDCIYLVGGSGGGHASLLMAGRTPQLWTAVSSWCPISDLAAWYGESRVRKQDPSARSYDDHIFDACGGDPISDPKAAEQAHHRSPLTWLKNAKNSVILDIGTGIHDGYTGSVPISHAIRAYNEVADPADRISREDMDFMVDNQAVPEHLRFEGEDPTYGEHRVLLRKTSGMVRLTLFEGGHDILTAPAFGFLEQQYRGQMPIWNSGDAAEEEKAELSK